MTKPSVEGAYVTADDRILDPTLLEKSAIERMPDPSGWRLLVLERQWVLIGRYAGARFKLEDGAEVRMINDDEVIGTILDPDDIVSFL